MPEGDALKTGFRVIKLKFFIFPVFALLLGTAITIPVFKTEKTVYFTFDDGPSEMTEEILEILEEEKIKATFFVIGPQSPETEERIYKIHSEGHSVGLHTMSHDYKKIYLSAESFWEDLTAERNWIYSITGKDCRIFRFPGGSKNSAAPEWLIEEVKEIAKANKMEWKDWNADGKDSLGAVLPAEEIAKNVLASEFIGSDEIVVLLHDSSTRTTTPEALRILIKEFRKLGYSFGKFE